MKDKEKKKKTHYLCDSHVNSPHANSGKKDPKSNVTIPSQDDVMEAKNWVDSNEK